MHELSVALQLVDRIVAVAVEQGARALGATVRVGDLACIQPDALRFAFEAARRGTPAERCELRVVSVPARLRCRICGAEGERDPLSPCGECSERAFEIVEGRELRLETVDVED